MIFEDDLRIITNSLEAIDQAQFENLVEDCRLAIQNGGKIIATGLGKNVPICEKFVGTMVSLGLPGAFMHTNSAIHGDMGIIKDEDLVIILTKSGETAESIHLYNLLENRNVCLWLLSFTPYSDLAKRIPRKLLLSMEHEGDIWDIVPNNSSILNLIVLQKLCIILARQMNVTLEQFKLNHPGGHIGELLKYRK